MRRRGRWGPLAACTPSQGVCRHTVLPSLPAATLVRPTDSSSDHISGDIRQSTKQPVSPEDLEPAPIVRTPLPLDTSVSHFTIFTIPDAYMFLVVGPTCFEHPVAARLKVGLVGMGMGASGQAKTPSKSLRSCLWYADEKLLGAFLCKPNHSRMASQELSFLAPSSTSSISKSGPSIRGVRG
ncbi:unnamed protein product [Striga asiatica]|uniref:Uncharacterized protein n=1 Tax=Striga asiatica TaxID=4170 RepID=A0A5A7QRN3_STRAF|nr:unnamed protein product [Striga asiatica]